MVKSEVWCHPWGYNPSNFACGAEAIAMNYPDDTKAFGAPYAQNKHASIIDSISTNTSFRFNCKLKDIGNPLTV